MNKEIEIPEGYEARIEGNKVIIGLKESDDERIRREILSFLKEGHPYYCPDSKRRQEWLAYLEKQKDEMQKQFNLGVQAGREEVMYEMEKEQKPAGWSEGDEKKLRTIISLMRASRTVDPFYDKMYLEGWLELLPERFNLPPKQEWSGEDKGNLLDVKCIIDEIWHNQYVREEIDHSCEELESLWNWLDNIWQKVEYPQPHWKPSEEQMEAFRIYLYHPQYIGNSEDIKIKLVESLYNDLKKLI